MATWTPKLSVGVPEIDQQHKELFGRADALLEAMQRGATKEELHRMLTFVDDYCAKHFAAEEEIMRARRYPGLAEHLAQHQDFVRRFESIAELFQAKGASSSVTIATQQLVSGWLVRHVGAIDTKLGAFVQGQGPAA